MHTDLLTRFLRLLAEYDWTFSAFVVDINGDLTSDDKREIDVSGEVFSFDNRDLQ